MVALTIFDIRESTATQMLLIAEECTLAGQCVDASWWEFFRTCVAHLSSTRRISAVSIVLVLSMGGTAIALEDSQMEVKRAVVLERTLMGLQQQWRSNTRKGITQKHVHIHANRLRVALCNEGKGQYCVPRKKKLAEKTLVAQNVDIEKLAYAVAVAETSNCTAGTGLSKNNCHGIFACTQGKCGPKTFVTTHDSFRAFKKLWLEKYGDRFPTLQDAKRYSGGPGDTWLNRVTIAYNRKNPY